jgi:hypothetical protein
MPYARNVEAEEEWMKIFSSVAVEKQIIVGPH